MADKKSLAETVTIDSHPIGKSDILKWAQLASILILIAAVPGSWYVYRDRQDALTEQFRQEFTENKKRNEEYDRWRGEMTTFIAEQRDINAKMAAHVTDRNIHVTEDQMKVFISSQLTGVTSGVSALNAKMEAIQRQMDRMERQMDSRAGRPPVNDQQADSR